MNVVVGADHRGFPLKERVKEFLSSRDLSVVDVGTNSSDSTDYPLYAFRVGEAVRDGRAERGVIVCGSANGIAIAANKVEGVRAAICLNAKHAELSRRHNDANVLVLGAEFLAPEDFIPTLEAWFASPFDGGRHQRRISQIAEYERTHRHA